MISFVGFSKNFRFIFNGFVTTSKRIKDIANENIRYFLNKGCW